MSRFKFINIVDLLFISILIFLIIFAWIQFFLKNIILSIFVSIILALSFIIILRYFALKKNKLNIAKKQYTNDLSRFKLAIQTMSLSNIARIIKKIIPTKYAPHIIKGDIFFTRDNILNLFTFYYDDLLTEPKLLQLIKTKQCEHLTIFCIDHSQEILATSKSFKNKTITLVNLEQLYNIFTSHNIDIDMSNIDISNPKISMRNILKNSISRNKSKGYFISGLILLLTSLIVPFKLYYVIISSVLLTLSLICRFHRTQKTPTSIFD